MKKVKVYEFDTKHLNEQIPEGSTIMRFVALEDYYKLLDLIQYQD